MKVIKKLNESKQDYEDLAYEVFSMLEDAVDKFYTWDIYPKLEENFPELAKQNSKVLYQGLVDDISNILTDAILEPVKDDLMYESVDSSDSNTDEKTLGTWNGDLYIPEVDDKGRPYLPKEFWEDWEQ